MTAGAVPQLAFYALLLVLPVAALVGRRIAVLRVLGMLMVWIGIFAVGLLVLGERARVDPYLARLTAFLKLDGQEVRGKEVRIAMAQDGHFWARVTVNGIRARMLIDSGATVTAVSSDSAAAMGLAVRRSAFPTVLRTANGDIVAATASVKTLKLGDIVARDLDIVVSPAFGDTDVLGMNFLSKLKSWRVEGRTLILTPHHPQNFT